MFSQSRDVLDSVRAKWYRTGIFVEMEAQGDTVPFWTVYLVYKDANCLFLDSLSQDSSQIRSDSVTLLRHQLAPNELLMRPSSEGVMCVEGGLDPHELN